MCVFFLFPRLFFLSRLDEFTEKKKELAVPITFLGAVLSSYTNTHRNDNITSRRNTEYIFFLFVVFICVLMVQLSTKKKKKKTTCDRKTVSGKLWKQVNMIMEAAQFEFESLCVT